MAVVRCHASELLDNAPLDELMRGHIEADPRNDSASNPDVCRVFMELAIAWWLSERGPVDDES